VLDHVHKAEHRVPLRGFCGGLHRTKRCDPGLSCVRDNGEVCKAKIPAVKDCRCEWAYSSFELAGTGMCINSFRRKLYPPSYFTVADFNPARNTSLTCETTCFAEQLVGGFHLQHKLYGNGTKDWECGCIHMTDKHYDGGIPRGDATLDSFCYRLQGLEYTEHWNFFQFLVVMSTLGGILSALIYFLYKANLEWW